MTLPASLRSCLVNAANLGLPFALWRRPGGERFEAAIACRAMDERAVFGSPQGQPFFALNRFDVEHANLADAIPADILVQGSDFRFHDGHAYQPRPCTPRQEQLVEVTALNARLRAGPAIAPAQTDESAYKALVEQAVQAIQGERFLKVVVSRSEARAMPADRDPLDLLETLASHYPAAFTALVVSPGLGAWLVATPETLLSYDGGMVTTMALAGTQWADQVPADGEISWPDKIIEEQALVARYIREAFGASAIPSVSERGPHTVRAAGLYHLRSDFSAQVDPAATSALAALLQRLHPTSAVGGMPKAAALDFLRTQEGYDRGYYTGFLGPVGVGGATDLFVNLRSAQLIDDQVYLFVGGGIVAASEPNVEWEETVQKTRTIGAAL